MKPDPRPRRFFLCNRKIVEESDLHLYPEAHILGDLRYMTDEGQQVVAFALWDEPVSATQVPPLAPVIRQCTIGDARLILCMVCKKTERWEQSEKSLKVKFEKLMSHYPDGCKAVKDELLSNGS